MISFEKSMELLNSIEIAPTNIVKLNLMDTQGYILAKDIVADYNSPEFPTSAMDGYAIKFDDMQLKKLPIQSINPAGADDIKELVGGKVIKTFTGSLMPKGSDTLIPIENVEVDGNYIVINEEVPFGFSVRDIGENFKKGEVLIKAGTKIGFEEIAVLASLNYVQVEVFAQPKVAVIATGEELLELGEEQTRPTQIRSSNNYTIEALAKEHNANVTNFGCIGDDIEKLKSVFKDALKSNDIVVSTGGVSVGDFDFVKDIVRDELGAKVVFKGVVIKPGQHIMVATVDNKTIIALPGFAYSSTVTALVYLLPILYRYQGSSYEMPIVAAVLEEDYKKKSKKTEFATCNVRLEDGEIKINFKGKKDGTSAIMTNMLGGGALTYLTERESSKKRGDLINIFLYQYKGSVK